MKTDIVQQKEKAQLERSPSFIFLASSPRPREDIVLVSCLQRVSATYAAHNGSRRAAVKWTRCN